MMSVFCGKAPTTGRTLHSSFSFKSDEMCDEAEAYCLDAPRYIVTGCVESEYNIFAFGTFYAVPQFVSREQ